MRLTKKSTPALTAPPTDELDDGTGDYYRPATDDDPPGILPYDQRHAWLALIVRTPEWLGRHVYNTVIKAHTVLGEPIPKPLDWEDLTGPQRMAWTAGGRAAYEEGYLEGHEYPEQDAK